MNIKRKSTLSPNESYKNINSVCFEYNITERVMRNHLKKVYGPDVKNLSQGDIDYQYLIKIIFTKYFKTDKFVVSKIRVSENYLDMILDEDFLYPVLPVPVEIYFDFKSNKDVNLYKLKNPDVYESLFSERIKLLNKLLK